MKKTIPIIVALFLLAASLHAQQQAGSLTAGVRLGAAIGFNESQNFGEFLMLYVMFPSFPEDPTTPADSVSEGSLVNFNFALYGNYALTRRLALHLEFNFMMRQGYELRFSADSYPTMLKTTHLSTLDIPLLLRLNLLNSQARLGLQAGPHVSIPLGRIEIEERNRHYHDIYAEYAVYSRFVFGATGGIFAAFPARPGRVVTDLRAIYDFDPIEAYNRGGGVEFIRRQAVLLTIGFEMSF